MVDDAREEDEEEKGKGQRILEKVDVGGNGRGKIHVDARC